MMRGLQDLHEKRTRVTRGGLTARVGVEDARLHVRALTARRRVRLARQVRASGTFRGIIWII